MSSLPLFDVVTGPSSSQAAVQELMNNQSLAPASTNDVPPGVRETARIQKPASPASFVEIRKTKKQLIEDFFITRVGQAQSSFEMHMKFGQAFRSRVSDINRDPSSPIRIVNETKVVGDVEQSTYVSELRK